MVGTVISLICWAVVILISGSFFSNISFINISFVLFQFGIPILYATENDYNNFYVSLFTVDTLNNGAIFSIFCIETFTLGILICLLIKKSYNRLIFANTRWARNTNMVEKASLLLFNICAVVYLPATIYGAFVLHSRFSLPALGGITKQFYFPAALLVLCYSKNPKVRKYIYTMYIIECILAIFTGGRTESLVPLLVLIVYYFQYRDNTKTSWISKLLLSFLLLIMIVLLVTVAQLRSGNTVNDFSLKSIYESFVGELGFNFTTILFVIVGTQLIGFKYGLTYLNDLVTLIPNAIDPTGIILKLQSLSGATWLQNTYGYQLGFGLGFSIIGEAYFNFGYYGVIAILIFGFLVALFQSKPVHLCTNWEKYIQLALLLGFITVTRRDFYQFLKQIEYSIFVMALYLYVFSKFKINNIK
jgi:oligosaccharide repeat unit polymerase